MAPTDVGVVRARPLRQYLNQPGLLNRQQKDLRIGHQRRVEGEGREHRPGVELRRLIGVREQAVQAAVIEDSNPLPDNAVRPSLRIGARHRIQHHGFDPCQPQLTGEHQAIGTPAHDDDVSHFVQSSEERRRVDSPEFSKSSDSDVSVGS